MSALGLMLMLVSGVDYVALNDEIERLKVDPDVIAELAKDLREAHRLEQMDSAGTESYRVAMGLRARAAEARRRKAVAELGLLGGNPLVRDHALETLRNAENPADLEAKAEELLTEVKRLIVEVVIGFRGVKARAVAGKEAADEMAKAPDSQPAPSKKPRPAKPVAK